MPYSAAQKRAYAIKMAMNRKKGVKPGITLQGKGGYSVKRSYSRRIPVARGRGKYDISSASDGDLAVESGKRLITGAIKYLPKLLGFGEYVQPAFKVKRNSLMDALGNNSPPAMESTNRRSQIIRHREYIQDIITGASGAFNLQSFPINPGLVTTFPWLAALAQNFQEYRVNGMIWEVKSTSADALNSTNTALGTIIMATNYDSVQANFTNKQQMENCEFASSCKQSCSCIHPIECDRTQTPVSELFVRTGAVPTGNDQRFYDLGNFQIATVGQQGSNVNIAELWVSYEIEFFKPILSSALGLEIQEDHFISSTGISASNIFGTSQTASSGSSLGSTISGNVVTFPARVNEGVYKLDYYITGNTTSGMTGPTCTFSGCTGVVFFNGANYIQSPNNGTTAANYMQSNVVSITAASGVSATVTYNTTNTLPVSGSPNMQLIVSQLNSSILT